MRYTVLFACFFLSSLLHAQKNKNKKEAETIYAYDSSWAPCSVEKAKYLALVQNLNDTTWQWNYYNFSGPLISVETYGDEKAQVPNGYFAWFDPDGRIDSSGYTLKGKKDGDWYYYSDKLAVDVHEKYENGKLIKREVRKDSAKKQKKDPSPGDVEASFPGGTAAWKKYLEKNYNFSQRTLKNKISGSATIDFVIDTTGSVILPRIAKSVEITMDKEVIRVISNSPKWIPAIQDGKKVRAYRRQPFSASIATN
jgi:periplasmic protein TonB